MYLLFFSVRSGESIGITIFAFIDKSMHGKLYKIKVPALTFRPESCII
jgi:hypothetical protein